MVRERECSLDREGRLPVKEAGEITILPFVIPIPTLFLRGDADSNLAVQIGDVITILSFLFSRGSAPECIDAADANDSGGVDLADAIFLLNYLFAGGSIPSYPFPLFGLDPTPDPLGEC